MIAFARIAVFVQIGAVKFRKTKIIGREMARHPVENDAQPGCVGGVDEIAEVIARPETARWRIQPRWLIAPATVKRVFINRQQFQMGKAHPFGIRHQLIGQFPIAQPEIIVGMTTP
ncbi:hypothetical protein D3C78_1607560 [compost metagenome]